MAKLQTIAKFLEGEKFDVTVTETQTEYAKCKETVLVARKGNIEVEVNKTDGVKILEETVSYNGKIVDLTTDEYYSLIGFYIIDTQRDMVKVLQSKLEKIEGMQQKEQEREGYKEHVLERIELDVEDERITESQADILKNSIDHIVDTMRAFFINYPDCELEKEMKKFDSVITSLLEINY